MAKKRSQRKADSPGDAPEFEEALEEIKRIVESLEEGTLPLAESLQQFERGVTLLRTCFRTLSEAEKKVELLTGLDEDGNPLTVPFQMSDDDAE